MMQLLKRSVREHLMYGIYTVAIVTTLGVYQQSAVGNRVSIIQRHSIQIGCYPKENTAKDAYEIALAYLSQKVSKYTQKLALIDFVSIDKMNLKPAILENIEKTIPFSNSNSCRRSN